MTEDFETRWHFNTSIAAIMELVNELYADEAEPLRRRAGRGAGKLTLLLAPFAPYLAAGDVGGAGPARRRCSGSRGRDFDPELAKEDEAEMVVQVNGKLRGRIRCRSGRRRRCSKPSAMADEKVKPFVEGKQIVKVIMVPDKLVNIVVK